MELKKVKIGDISAAEYSAALLTFADVAARFKNAPEDEKKRTLAGRILLKEMLFRHCGRDVFPLRYNENGKPLSDACFFSISHSADLAVCAVSDYPIGVDVERIGEIKRRDSYMLFSPLETEYVNQTDSAARFYTLWTRKEAYVKAIGGRLKDAAETELVTADLTLKEQFGGFRFSTEQSGGFLISVAEQGH